MKSCWKLLGTGMIRPLSVICCEFWMASCVWLPPPILRDPVRYQVAAPACSSINWRMTISSLLFATGSAESNLKRAAVERKSAWLSEPHCGTPAVKRSNCRRPGNAWTFSCWQSPQGFGAGTLDDAGGYASLFEVGPWLVDSRHSPGLGAFEVDGRYQAARLKDRLLGASTEEVSAIVRNIEPYRRWANPVLNRAFDEYGGDQRKLLHLRLALLPVDVSHLEALQKTMLEADAVDVIVIREALYPFRQQIARGLWDVVANVEISNMRRLRAACALALLDTDSDRWPQVGADIVGILVTERYHLARQWIDALQPVSKHLLGPLQVVFRRSLPSEDKRVASAALAEYVRQAESLIELILSAEPDQLDPLLLELQRSSMDAAPLLRAQIQNKVGAKLPDEAAVTLTERRANARSHCGNQGGQCGLAAL